jgi:hypothetical protein
LIHSLKIAIGLICFSLAISLSAAVAGTFPFESVIQRNNSVVATLPGTPRWLLKQASKETRLTNPGEAFTLQDGDSFSLIERHSNYRVTCRISSGRAGLEIESTFDARSFGDGVTKKKYFIPAQ